MAKSVLSKLAATAGLAVGAGVAVVKAAQKKNKPIKNLLIEDYAEKAVDTLLAGMTLALPDPYWPEVGQYVSENFYEGSDIFRNESKRGAKWKLGYARNSLVPDDYLVRQYFIAGYLHFPANAMTGVIDDQAVRVICLDDASGNGTVVFAVIDCVGISNTDIRRIRAMLEDFAKENNIISINVSATHCHSAIDTQGLWGDLTRIVPNNVKAIKEHRPENLVSGRDKQFMDNLYNTVTATIKQAHAEMKKGTLYYSITDDIKYARDKRPPDVIVEDLVSLRFVPTDGSRETVAVFMAAHPVALGDKNTKLSSDYIYYIEEEVNKADKNFIFFQGAELAVATDSSFVPEDEPEAEGYVRYGRALGKYLVSIPDDEFKKVKPVLNIAHSEVLIPCNNTILHLAAKAGIVNNRLLKSGSRLNDVCLVSEIGYFELGENLAFVLMPGETAPEIILGGGYGAEESYTKTDWTYPAFKDMIDPSKHLTAIGLCNDAIGYIIPDNDYGSKFAAKHYEESVSAGSLAGSTLTRAFAALTAECGRFVTPEQKGNL